MTRNGELKLDDHKMIHHLDRVNEWLREETIAPISLDIGIAKWCNIGCTFCAADAYQKQKMELSGEILNNALRDAAQHGVRSVSFAGDGEPTLNPSLYGAVSTAKASKLSVGLHTNGILLDISQLKKLLSELTYLKFTFNAASREGYIAVHQVDKFDEAVSIIKKCVEIKNKDHLGVTLGIQMVLIPECANEIVDFARLGIEMGVDYVQIKQFSYVPSSNGKNMRDYDVSQYKNYYPLLKQAEALSTKKTQVYIKWKDIEDEGRRSYDTCYGTPFLHHIMSDGKVYPCATFFNNDNYCFGDLKEKSYKEILYSDRYKTIVAKIRDEVDVHKECGKHCRQNSINTFLYQLKNTPGHVNFP